MSVAARAAAWSMFPRCAASAVPLACVLALAYRRPDVGASALGGDVADRDAVQPEALGEIEAERGAELVRDPHGALATSPGITERDGARSIVPVHAACRFAFGEVLRDE